MITQYRATIEEKEQGGFVIHYEEYNEDLGRWFDVECLKQNRTGGYSSRRSWTVKPGTLHKRQSYGPPVVTNGKARWHWSAKMLAERQIERWMREDKKRARELRNTVVESKKLDL